MTTLHDFGSALTRPLDTSFKLSQFHGHGSWLLCEVALSNMCRGCSHKPCAHERKGGLNHCPPRLAGRGGGQATGRLSKFVCLLIYFVTGRSVIKNHFVYEIRCG